MEKQGTILMHRYEMGRLLGQGTFAKVYYGRNTADGQGVAIKIVDKEKVMKVGLVDQIKREIAVMRLVRHPNVVRLYEVMASKRKIYFVMEYVRGGELFNKVAKGRLKEDAARQYFQQLVAAVDYCHSRGVYHRDLKPENLLLDEKGNLKVSDFGLSALLSESQRQVDGLLHTTCGTPAYVAPEVLSKRGYDGAKADIWSCGVVLFVLLAGQLPFHDANLMNLYRKISKGEFKCPQWFPPEARKLLSRILDPHPSTRITVAKLMDNVWFKKGFKQVASPPRPTVLELQDFIPSDVAASFEDNDSSDSASSSCSRSTTDHLPQPPPPASDPVRPSFYNAFNIISLSKGFDLSGLFEEEDTNKKVARFTTKRPVPEIVAKLEEVAVAERFQCEKMDGTVKLVASTEGRKGPLEIDAEIFEVTSSFHVVELKKMGGDTFEYNKFCYQELKPSLKDIVWTWERFGQQ